MKDGTTESERETLTVGRLRWRGSDGKSRQKRLEWSDSGGWLEKGTWAEKLAEKRLDTATNSKNTGGTQMV